MLLFLLIIIIATAKLEVEPVGRHLLGGTDTFCFVLSSLFLFLCFVASFHISALRSETPQITQICGQVSELPLTGGVGLGF